MSADRGLHVLLDVDYGPDGGTHLRRRLEAGADPNAAEGPRSETPLDVFDATHDSSPIGWAVHGSRYSGGASRRQDAYVALVRMLLEAGSTLCYPGDESDAYLQRLLRDASPSVREVLERRPGV